MFNKTVSQVSNLVNFLRRCDTPLCLIASDFVQDFPDDPAVTKAEGYLKKKLEYLILNHVGQVIISASKITTGTFSSFSGSRELTAFGQLNEHRRHLVSEAIQRRQVNPCWSTYSDVYNEAIGKIDRVISFYEKDWSRYILRILRPRP